MFDFKTQQECFCWVCGGNKIYMNDGMVIKFIYGRLCAIINSKWTPCPVTFEHPSMFSKVNSHD